MATLKWSNTLSVGNRQIDDDHRHLFDLLDQLHDAMRAGRANSVLGSLLDELVLYTGQHFQREEQFMLRIGYKDYAAHKAEHDKLMADVRALQQRFASGAITLSLSVNQFLAEWLSEHIMARDKQLATELVAR